MAERDIFAEIESEDARNRARFAGIAAPDVAPDQMGRALSIAQKRGTAPLAVAENLPEFEHEERLSELETTAASHPAVGRFLSAPENVKLAEDDLPALTKLARAITQQYRDDIGNFFATMGHSAKSMLAAGSEWMAEIERDEVATYGAGDTNLDDASLARNAKLTQTQAGALETQRSGQAATRKAEDARAQAVVQQYPDGSVGYHAMGVARSLPIFGAAVVSRSPTVGAGIIGLSTAASQRSSALADGATTNEATASGLVHGTLEGSMDALTLGIARFGMGPVKKWAVERFGETLATRVLSSATRTAPRRVGVAVAEGAITEIPTTLGQMASDEVILGQKYTGDDYVRGIRDSAIQGGGVSGAVYAATAPIRKMQRATLERVTDSLDAAGRLDAITAAAAEGKLGTRSPGKLEGLAADMAEETVYVPAEAIRTLYQQGDAAAFVESLTGDAQALELAGEHGDIAIPLAKWVSIVAQLPNGPEIAKHARTQVDGYSRADLESLDIDAELTTLDGQLEAEGNDTSKAVQDAVLGELLASGIYKPADAEVQAQLLGKVFGTLAKGEGTDAKTLFDRYNLRVNPPPSLATKAVGAVRKLFQGTTKAPAATSEFRQWFGASQVADGATPRPVYHGTAEDFGVFAHDRSGAATGHMSAPLGFFFAEDRGKAERYAEKAARGVPADERVVDAFLSIQKPKTMTVDDLLAIESQAEAAALRDSLIAQGFDGIHMPDVGQWIVFDSTQIKSASENSGAFSLDNPSIYYQPAYHGTPHDVDRFSLQKIGTGEGAQAYGYGLYFASQKEVAESYRNALSTGQMTIDGERFTPRNYGITKIVADNRGDTNAMRAALAAFAERERANPNPYGFGEDAERIVVALDADAFDSSATGNLYSVEVPDDADLLDGDKPLSEQPERIKNALRPILARVYRGDPNDSGNNAAETVGRWLQDGGPKGQAIYQAMSEEYGGPQGASHALYEAGIPGLRYLDGGSRPKGEGSHNYVIWDEAAISEPTKLYQPADGTSSPRGQIEIGAGRTMSIRLFKGANLSTFLHESGHLFLEVLTDLAADPNASERVKAMLGDIRTWVGNDGGPFTTDQHEQFARGFEAYLREGKAPSPELVSAFARFGAWLRDIYRNLRALNVELTPEVRSVFDRMIASDEEIEAAQVKQGMVPLNLSPESRALVSDAQWNAYVAALEAGTEEARQDVLNKLMDAHRKAEDRQRKEEEARVREEVEAQAELAPAVRALRVLNGAQTLNGEALPEALRNLHLDPGALLPDDRAALKGLGVTRKIGGVSPDTAAAVLGFTSGDHLVQALAGVRDLAAQVDVEVARIMAERHPDPLNDGSLPEAAMEAVHNDKRVAAMEAELALLATLAGQPKPNRRVLRAIADAAIARKTVRHLKPAEHLAAERKAARAATKAAATGDFAAALVAKREQLLQAALYSAALQAQKTAEKAVDYARKFDKPSTRERIGKAGNDLLEMIDGILAAYSFRPVSDKARERTDTLRRWYDRMVEAGVTPQVPEAVLAQIEASRLTHYRDLTVADLSAIVDLLKQLEHQAREANTVRLGELEADLDAAATELAGGIRGGLQDRGPPPISETLQKRWPERGKRAWRLAGSWLLRLRTLAQWIDGEGNVAGPFHRLIVRPLDRAQAAYLDAMKDYGSRVVALFDDYLKGTELTRPIWIASLGQSLTKSDILAVALNMGNASNMQRLVDGRGWGPVHIAELMQQMTKADWDFVQATWDTLETLWPQIAAQQKRLTGVEPPKIERQPVQTPFGVYPGGYYPLVYDRDSAEWKKFAGADDDSFFDPMGLTSLPPNGQTKARVDAAKIPVKLDLSIIPQHLSSVLKDLTHRETLIGINRLVKRPEVVEAMRETLGAEYTDMVQTKLRQVATDQVVQGGRLWSALGKLSRGVRRHVGIMAQGLSVSSGIKQLIGLSNSMEVLSQRHGKRSAAMLAQATTDILKPGMVESIMTMSGEMRHRIDTADVDIRLNMQRYLSGQMDGSLAGKLKGVHDGAIAHAYIMIRYIQTYAVDLPLWQAAHEGALRDGLTGDDAIAAADDAVITAQGAGGAKDTALIEGQVPLLEWFTMFYSYASAYLNRQVSLGRDIGKAVDGGVPRLLREMPLLSARVVFLIALPTILDELMSQAFGQSDGAGDEDDDGDEDLADEARFLAKRMWAYMFYGIPGLRDFAGAKYGYRVSPVQSIGDAWGRLLNDIDKGIDPDEDVAARKVVRDAVNVTGYTLGLPLQGPYRHVDYLWRVLEGEEQPESIPEFAAAFAAGKREQR